MSNSNNIEPTFLDSNVLANWVIVSSAIEKKTRISKDEKKKLLNKLSTPVKSSYNLLEKIRNKNPMENTFFTSDIAICEIFSVIGDEYRAKVLHRDGIPIRYWSNMIYKVDLSRSYLRQINNEINNFYNLFVTDNKIIRKSDFNFNEVGELVFLFKCNTHDALLIAESLKMGCKYFVTEDQRLRDRLKVKGYTRIELFPSDRYLREVFK